MERLRRRTNWLTIAIAALAALQLGTLLVVLYATSDVAAFSLRKNPGAALAILFDGSNFGLNCIILGVVWHLWVMHSDPGAHGFGSGVSNVDVERIADAVTRQTLVNYPKAGAE